MEALSFCCGGGLQRSGALLQLLMSTAMVFILLAGLLLLSTGTIMVPQPALTVPEPVLLRWFSKHEEVVMIM